jgi:translin
MKDAMRQLDLIAEQIHESFDRITAARDKALSQTRTLTRHCAHTIRAVHRNERENAIKHLEEARRLAETLRESLEDYPTLYFAGYTQDALKEYAEASIVYILVYGGDLPRPQDLGLVDHTYLKGLAEVVGELRRRCLDILRDGYSKEGEQLLGYMDDIYAVLVTMDYPDAVTGGLRRLTDIARSIIERTRGDITRSLREERLEESLRNVEIQLERFAGNPVSGTHLTAKDSPSE